MLICIVGKTASGKDTFSRLLKNKYKLKSVVSYTTRPMRESETEGVEHYFIDDARADMMLSMPDDIAAFTQIGDNRYFATIDELMSSDIYIIDPIGIDSLKERFPYLDMKTVYLDADEETRIRRAISRGDNVTDIINRVMSEDAEFEEFLKHHEPDLVINTLTDDYDHCADIVYEMMKECGYEEKD